MVSSWPQHNTDIRLINVVICYGYYGWPRTRTFTLFWILQPKTRVRWFLVPSFSRFFPSILHHIMLWVFPKRHQGLACSKYIWTESKCTATEKNGSSSFFLWLLSQYIIYACKKCIFSWTFFSFTASLLPTYLYSDYYHTNNKLDALNIHLWYLYRLNTHCTAHTHTSKHLMQLFFVVTVIFSWVSVVSIGLVLLLLFNLTWCGILWKLPQLAIDYGHCRVLFLTSVAVNISFQTHES